MLHAVMKTSTKKAEDKSYNLQSSDEDSDTGEVLMT